jgi:hypothetical protein
MREAVVKGLPVLVGDKIVDAAPEELPIAPTTGF